MNQFEFKSYNKNNSWFGIIVIVAIIFIIFFIIQNLYKLFALLAPVFLILTAILDYRVIAKFGIVLYELLRYRTALGILAVIFSLIGLPFVSAAMFFNAFMNYRTKRKNKKKYLDYIDVDEENNDVLDIGESKKIKLDDYEELFD